MVARDSLALSFLCAGGGRRTTVVWENITLTGVTNQKDDYVGVGHT
jgi:hypothetical protein